jgi:hypothetical protein
MEKSIKEIKLQIKQNEMEIERNNIEIEKVRKEIESIEYKALLKVRRIQNISGLFCLLSIAGLFLSVFVFVWWTLILALKVFVSSVIIYCFFWIINKSAGAICKQLEDKCL